MRKSPESPRRVYRTHGSTVVLFKGIMYGMKGESKIVVKHPAKVTANEDGTVTVSQRAPKKKGVSETWRKFRS